MDYLSEVIKAAVWGERPPETPKWIQWVHRNPSSSHCEECLKLHKCWFFIKKRQNGRTTCFVIVY